MKKIFVIADTHNRIVEPPRNYDVTIHAGDCINAMMHTRYEYQDHVNAFRKYDYQVIGNHEDMSFYSQSSMVRNKITELNADSQTWLRQLRSEPVWEFSVSGIRFRLSHYIDADPVTIAGQPLTPAAEMEIITAIANTKKYDVIIYGHTHEPFIKKINGVWIINSGHGEYNEYAEIIIDDDCEIKIELKILMEK